jgi:hypothetical protein
MRLWIVILATALAGCVYAPTDPLLIGKGRVFIQAVNLDGALRAGQAYCAGSRKEFVVVKTERRTRNHWASVTFTCGQG